MRACLLATFIFLTVSCCFCQVQTIDTIPADGILLDKGWKFHAGDNPDWMKSDFDDSSWQMIDATNDIYYLPEISRQPVGWFRIKFRIDSSFLNKPLAFKIYQSIASEIYLNGKLLMTYGKIGKNQNNTIAYRPGNDPNGIIFSQPGQVLSVWFAVQKSLPYTTTTHPYYAFRFRIYKVEQADSHNEIGQKYPLENTFYIGIFLTLFVIHFGIFLRFRHRKADLYFSFSLMSQTLANGLYLLLTMGNSTMNFITYAFAVDWILLLPGYNFFLFLAINSLFTSGKPWLNKVMFLIALVSSIFFIENYRYGQTGILVSFFITTFTSLFLSIKALTRGKKDAAIIIAGLTIYLLSYSSFVLFYLGFISDTPIGLGTFSLMAALYTVGILTVPATLSLYLSRDLATTSRNLINKLKEVQILSEKTILQEKEKQEILESQHEILEKQVEERTIELNQSLNELKSTQAQLIQSEKMASLGELTAGIAHEIQNPLNFVNNFSEVNKEMIDEATGEIDKGNYDEIKNILNDIKDNSEKINHHGKRADAIVKGMLQHSRTSSGQKELTDINALCDEYLRLSYHGLRAKDKSFNAKLETDFDASIGKINIVPQDIGRVLLNLINNAFYAVSEKRKTEDGKFDPCVSIQTKKLNDKVEIKVSDNGSGVPQKILDKIFQPFFTTKPTGQGTGLGLSLAYDIVKAHGGEIKVETEEGEGSEFLIQLPV